MKFIVASVVLMSISAMAEAEQAPSQNKAIAIAQAPQDQATAKVDLAIGVCQLVNSLGVNGRDDPLSPIYALSPAQDVSAYFSAAGSKKWLDYTKNVTVTLQQGSEHGTIKEERNSHFRYLPLANYLGPDNATFLVGIEGLKVKTVYHFKVIDGGAIGGTEGQDKKNCPKGISWEISSNSGSRSSPSSADSTKRALVVDNSTPLRSSPAASSEVVITLNLGAVAEILEFGKSETISGKAGRWVKVHTYRPTRYSTPDAFKDGWIFDAQLAYEESFKPVNRWEGPRTLYFGGGDYVNQISISTNGQYIREDSEIGKDSGKLFRMNDIYILRSNSKHSQSYGISNIKFPWDYFYRDQSGRFCEYSDIDESGVCPDGPIEGNGPQ